MKTRTEWWIVTCLTVIVALGMALIITMAVMMSYQQRAEALALAQDELIRTQRASIVRLQEENKRLTEALETYAAQDYEGVINKAAEEHGVDPKLIKAVISVESSGNPAAESPRGAKGLMQLMPRTAEYLSVINIFDPEENILAGAKYLKILLDRFDNDLQLTLAAYNAGPSVVAEYNGIPPFKETINFIEKVMNYYRQEG